MARTATGAMPAKSAICTLLAECADGVYLTTNEMVHMASERWNIPKAAIKTAMNCEMQELFEVKLIPSDPRIRWKYPVAKAYRWNKGTAP